MAIAAWACGIIGGLCAVAGIVTAAGVDLMIGAGFTSMLWLTLGMVLLLASIAFILGKESI